jgi:hypothetical protein
LTRIIGTHTQFFRKGSAEVLLLKIRSNAMKFVNLSAVAGHVSGAAASLGKTRRVHENARKAQ